MDSTALSLAIDLASERDRAHEGLIQAVTDLLISTQDYRYVPVQKLLVQMRSAEQVRRMEEAMGLAGR